MVEHLIISYREEVAVQSGRTGRDNWLEGSIGKKTYYRLCTPVLTGVITMPLVYCSLIYLLTSCTKLSFCVPK